MKYSDRAVELVEKLKAAGIIGARGKIELSLLGVSLNINGKSAIGDLLQEWLGAWMKQQGIYFRTDNNTQKFPDFYLGENDTENLLEVKTFDYSKAPNFDVAQFDAYTTELATQAYRLDSDYLILGYTLEQGILTIQDIWLKKIWEITCGATDLPLRVQRKKGKIYNIRPYNFKNCAGNFPPFGTKEEFLAAIRDTLAQYKYRLQENPDQWYQEVLMSYSALEKER